MARRVVRFFLHDRHLLLRYLAVGLASAAIELSLFSLFYLASSWPLLAANGCALAWALLFNFLAHRRFTFKATDRALHRLRWYAVMQLVAISLNNVLVWTFIKEWGWWPPLAKVTQIGLVFVWSFSFSRLVVFARWAGSPPP